MAQQLRAQEERRKRPYKFYERDILRKSSLLSDSMFTTVHRMDRSLVEILLPEVAPYLPLGVSPNKKSLSQVERVTMFLYAASGDIPQRHAAYAFNCGKSTVDENNRLVIEAMFEALVPNYIYLPEASEARREARQFANGTNLPLSIWGAMDGFHTGVCTSKFLLLHTVS